MSNWILVGPVVGIVLLASGLILGYLVFPPIVTKTIIESVQIVKDTEQYDRWREVPQPLEFKVYIFNVTNPLEVQQGGTPRVEEIGPYVYLQYRRKYNIRFSRDNEQVSYYQQQTFKFDAERSHPYREDDPIVVLNMHMNSIIQTIEHDSPFILSMLNGELKNIFGPDATTMFMTTTPKKFLFDGVEFCKDAVGVAQLVCMTVEDRKSQSITKSNDGRGLKFSMFSHKNTTHDGLYEINTGIRRLEKLMKIERWNEQKTLKTWKTDKFGAPSVCQYINGTDGSAVAPFREKNDNFYIYSSDICRSVQLFFQNETEYKGIPGYRYETRENFLTDIGPCYGNDCFCIDKISGALKEDNGCLYSGAIDLTECLDAPIVATLPHFYGGHPTYEKMIDGINPDPRKHQIFLEVEPRTGSPLRGGKKAQFNMFLKKIDYITMTSNFKTPRLFPVLWVDEGIELNDEMAGLIKKDLINTLLILDIVQWTLVGVGAALIVGMLIWYVLARKKMSKTSSTEIITDQSTSTSDVK
ncbi:sensory neuron membrane protein 2 isoform X1 [Chironomus tepperi]|uniref:sensory neuron membrane protein 2 isoform X1 n=1 Tax=Chironomus tepperi TaxID=113505 RepID=UPI00391F5690